MKQQWTIRVIQVHNSRDRLPGIWMEQLRRLGTLRVLREWNGEADGTECFELHGGNGDKIWAEMNAERMRSFGINAAAAPRWSGGKIE